MRWAPQLNCPAPFLPPILGDPRVERKQNKPDHIADLLCSCTVLTLHLWMQWCQRGRLWGWWCRSLWGYGCSSGGEGSTMCSWGEVHQHSPAQCMVLTLRSHHSVGATCNEALCGYWYDRTKGQGAVRTAIRRSQSICFSHQIHHGNGSPFRGSSWLPAYRAARQVCGRPGQGGSRCGTHLVPPQGFMAGQRCLFPW